MISRRSLALATAATLLFTVPAFADGLPPYLGPKQLDLTIMLPPPPPSGSAMQASEIQAVIAIQKNASPERIKLAIADAKETVFDMYTRTFGDKFAAANLPKATPFFERVTESEDDTVDPAKKFFARVRPFLASSEIKDLVPASKSGSWPSGHTTRVTMVAIVLSAMLPEKRDMIWARADEYAESRIIGGMHYPSDIDAGHRAGTAMAAAMFTDAAFKADFDVAKAEVRKALGL
jgi:acid phosphatase (class A)